MEPDQVTRIVDLANQLLSTGNLVKVQDRLYDYFRAHPETRFFENIEMWIQKHTCDLKVRKMMINRPGSAELQDMALFSQIFSDKGAWGIMRRLIKLLQNICESQYQPLQLYISKQSYSYQSVDLPLELVSLLSLLTVYIDLDVFDGKQRYTKTRPAYSRPFLQPPKKKHNKIACYLLTKPAPLTTQLRSRSSIP